MIWHPHVTVAAIVERKGRFLLVEEHTESGVRFNQPAGHWEPGETLLQAVVRETREETAHTVEPVGLVGVYHWHQPERGRTWLRFAFATTVLAHDPAQALDTEIIRAVWMTLDEIRACRPAHRSPLVLRNVEDYLSGQRYPLSLYKVV